MEKVIDFSVLEGMNLPKIDINPKDEISLEDLGIQDLKDNAIEVVEGIENFNQPKKKEEPKEGATAQSKTEEQEETEETEEQEEESSETDEDTSAVKLISNWAKEQELINFDPEKFEDSEDWLKTQFASHIKGEIEKGVQNELSKYPEEVKELAEKFKKGVPFDELLYSKSREIEYSNIKDEEIEKDKELQKRLVSEWIQLSDQDATEDEIKKKLQKLDDAVLLEDEAKIAHKKLQKYEVRYQQNLEEAAAKEELGKKEAFEKRMKDIEKSFLDTEESFSGIKETPEQRKKNLDAYTKLDSKGKTALMKAIDSDPKAWYKITKLMVEMKGDFEALKKEFQTEAAKKVKESIGAGRTGSSSTKGITDLDIKKLQKVFKRK